MPNVILALDQGTTSSRAIIFDAGGRPVASAHREFSQCFPQPGWVEHDPEAIWVSQRDAASEVITTLGLSPRDIAAIGITNQRETTLVWDRKTGEPICNAIVWQDRRTAGFCDELKAAGRQPFVQAKTGLVIDAYFAASKLKWILDHVPGARQRARAGELVFGTVDTWLIHKLTGGSVHVTDVSNASRTMLFDIHKGEWCDELLALFDVPRSMLPTVRSSSETVGEVGDVLPLARGVKIAGVAGDQQAALFGQTCFERGMAKCTYGTGCFMLMNVGAEPIPSRNQLLTTVAWRLNDRIEFAHEGSVFIGGAVVQWLRDGLGVIKSSDEIESLAASVPDSGDVYLVPAFAGLGAPHWDQRARGTITGLTRGTTAAHLARAALEGIAFQVADVLEVMEKDSGLKIAELRVDGGAARNDLLMQFQADLLGVPIIRPRVTETTALGAAYLAGLAVGFWKSADELRANAAIDRRFEPTMPREVALARRRRWDEALRRAREWEERPA